MTKVYLDSPGDMFYIYPLMPSGAT